MRVVFAGSPEFAANILQRLIDTPFKPVAVYTQPDRPTGRGRKLQPNPVKTLATEHEIDVHQPNSLKDQEAQNELRTLSPDLLVVVAYGLILPQEVLDVPKFGCINVHASLLPRWRGAAPIEHAFMAGDAETGISIMQMDAGLDTGPVFSKVSRAITNETTIDDLTAALCQDGATELLAVLESLSDGTAPLPSPQSEEGATYAPKLTAKDRIVDWEQNAAQISRRINALATRMPVRCRLADRGVQLLAASVSSNSPEANTDVGVISRHDDDGFYVRCAMNELHVTELKVEGKGVTRAVDAMNGYPAMFAIGNIFQ